MFLESIELLALQTDNTGMGLLQLKNMTRYGCEN